MTYYINTETAQEEASTWHACAEKGGIVSMIGLTIGAVGLTGAILARVFLVSPMPTICFGMMIIGVIIMGISGVFIGTKPLTVAYMDAAQHGKILKMSTVPASSHDDDLVIVQAIVEKEDGHCETVELGYAKACKHSHYCEDTINLHDEIVYIVP